MLNQNLLRMPLYRKSGRLDIFKQMLKFISDVFAIFEVHFPCKLRQSIFIFNIFFFNSDKCYICSIYPQWKTQAQGSGALGGCSPLSFSEKNSYSGKNIIFFGQINGLLKICQSVAWIYAGFLVLPSYYLYICCSLFTQI